MCLRVTKIHVSAILEMRSMGHFLDVANDGRWTMDDGRCVVREAHVFEWFQVINKEDERNGYSDMPAVLIKPLRTRMKTEWGDVQIHTQKHK